MRRNLGKQLLLLSLLLVTSLYAGGYEWSLKSNKQSVYVNEAIELEYSCKFEDQANLYVIEFTPQEQKSSEYRIFSLGVVEKIREGKRSVTYRYVIFPKQPGHHEYPFSALMRKTTQASIENSVIGRDNVEDYAFSDTWVTLPPLVVEVKDHQERMTGHFSLRVTLDKQEVKAYEPVHLDLHMQGEGDFDLMEDINLSIEGVKVFSEPGERNYRLTKDGYKGEFEQKFSLVADRDFEIKPITITYFDIYEKKRITLRSEHYKIDVTPAFERETLLDVVEEDDSTWWSWSYLNYIMMFVLGILAERYFQQWRHRVSGHIADIDQDIYQAKSVKQLLTKLILLEDMRFEPLINKYEGQSSKEALKALKSEIKRLIIEEI